MAYKRLRRHVGLFNVPDRRDEDDSDNIGVLGGPAGDSGLFGDPGHASGVFDVPDRTPAEMPGLFERPPQPAADNGSGPHDKPARGAGGGLFDKPAPRRKHSGE